MLRCNAKARLDWNDYTHHPFTTIDFPTMSWLSANIFRILSLGAAAFNNGYVITHSDESEDTKQSVYSSAT